ncbi:hypothetical protein COO60DRAFT_1082570 [Scenedesmus sp. NREL 46B-D3]|nr:hypothetical protein COO60DRAFT_1082570 [Scenedesmus sp. NREL 46B-D3]
MALLLLIWVTLPCNMMVMMQAPPAHVHPPVVLRPHQLLVGPAATAAHPMPHPLHTHALPPSSCHVVQAHSLSLAVSNSASSCCSSCCSQGTCTAKSTRCWGPLRQLPHVPPASCTAWPLPCSSFSGSCSPCGALFAAAAGHSSCCLACCTAAGCGGRQPLAAHPAS